VETDEHVHYSDLHNKLKKKKKKKKNRSLIIDLCVPILENRNRYYENFSLKFQWCSPWCKYQRAICWVWAKNSRARSLCCCICTMAAWESSTQTCFANMIGHNHEQQQDGTHMQQSCVLTHAPQQQVDAKRISWPWPPKNAVRHSLQHLVLSVISSIILSSK